MVKMVYGGLSIMLVHNRHLKLKLIGMNLFDKQRWIWGTKTWVLL